MKNEQKNIDYIISLLSENIENCNGNYIIGIDGYSCAGKTTLTQNLINLKAKRQVIVFHIDDYIRTRKYRYNTGNEQWYEHYHLQWDAEGIRESLFRSIKNNELQLNLQFYNKGKDCTVDSIYKINPKSIIIIEGVFLQRIEWKEFFDYMIFVDCPREIRFQRELTKSEHTGDINEVLNKYKVRYWAAEEYYESTYRPLQAADLVIDNF